MVKVFLHGELGRKFGFEHKYKIRTKKQAIKALMGNHSKFRSEVLSKTQMGIFYRLVDKRGKVSEACHADYNKECLEEVHIVPSIIGSGKFGNFLKNVAIGTLLYFTGGAIGGLVGKIITNIGISFIIQGIQTLLMPDPTPQTMESPLDTNSYIFGNTNNNVTQGFSIPVLYGQLRIGSNVISTNAQSIDISQQ